MAAVPVSLQINCGFCRVAIKKLSSRKNKFKRAQIDIDAREKKFREQFSTFDELDESCVILTQTETQRMSRQFNQHCNEVLNMFSKKWTTAAVRLEYLSNFSISSWEKLSQQEALLIKL